jgi:hypothetical protein
LREIISSPARAEMQVAYHKDRIVLFHFFIYLILLSALNY